MMIALIKPILFNLINSDNVKRLVVDLLRAYARTTDNTVDDKICDYVETSLFPCMTGDCPAN
jgi:hypothetical protein